VHTHDSNSVTPLLNDCSQRTQSIGHNGPTDCWIYVGLRTETIDNHNSAIELRFILGLLSVTVGRNHLPLSPGRSLWKELCSRTDRTRCALALWCSCFDVDSGSRLLVCRKQPTWKDQFIIIDSRCLFVLFGWWIWGAIQSWTPRFLLQLPTCNLLLISFFFTTALATNAPDHCLAFYSFLFLLSVLLFGVYQLSWFIHWVSLKTL